MAGVIERVQKPSLVLAHNKTLAAQLCNEFRTFFPDNAVEYFVSLLRLLPARGLRPVQGPLHREGLGHQPGGRPAAPRRHGRALRAPRRDHRGQRLGHLRPRLAADLRRQPAGPAQGRHDRSRQAAAQARLDPVLAQRPGAGPRQLPRARRGAGDLPRLRRVRLPRHAVRRRDRAPAALRPAHGRAHRGRPRARRDLAGDALQRPRGHGRGGRRGDRARAQRALRRARGRGQAAREPPPAPAHAVRHGDAARDGLLQRHRELLAHPRRAQPRRSALLPARLLPRRLPLLHRRVPSDRAADRRHARGRPLAQADARRLRLPAAQRARQPPADLRRVPHHHAADGLRLRHAGRLRALALGPRRRADRAPDGRRRSGTSRCARRATRSTTS